MINDVLHNRGTIKALKLPLFLLIMAFVFGGCAQSPKVLGMDGPQEVDTSDQTFKYIQNPVIALPEKEDIGLYLYRNHITRRQVIDFYSEVIGSRQITMAIVGFAEQNDVSLSLAVSLAWVESRFSPEAVNRNAYSVDRGLFQLNSKSFPHLEEEEFYDPVTNAQHAMQYLRSCLDHGTSETVALAMYNAGRARVQGRGTPEMTLRYIDKIYKYRIQLERDFEEAMSRHVILSRAGENEKEEPSG
ncbi:MAG: transglycosylase SLT domain-containing protein [Spirochaetales bacterium]|nr:transglycosylase SLT domain-containing protein [Spirochaetales bacterium]MCF7937369.1 transglycosylase SLT domain-containing protein [Spirochaetales bacterium]